ncbi:MAG: hypothetical protein AMK75_07925 [Planctomycetes bacterium SM23_65]|nr:MAG: hypothetical protein AMK75_07925 [Planctomycetes bacterium SM23_65]
MDHYFGEILKSLDKLRLKGRTLVVATSDHGSEFQEHGFLEKKVNLYEELVQVPLILRLPGVLPARKKVRGLCETMDIAPTILDVCGLPVHEQMDGRSLLGRIRGRRTAKTAAVVAHTLHEKVFFYEHFMIRTERYKYLRCRPFYRDPRQLRSRWGGDVERRFERLASVAARRGRFYEELYDLKLDPAETTNLRTRKPALAGKLRRQLSATVRALTKK